MEYLAARIQELRKQNNYSQDELAMRVGVTRQAISKWEREEGLPDLYNIKKLAEVFNVTVDELIQEHKTELIEENKNKLAIILMSIPGFIFLVSIPILVLLNIIQNIFFISEIFTPDIIYLDSNWGVITLPILLILSYFFIKSYIKVFSSNESRKFRLINIVLYGLSILTYLILLLFGNVNGFAYIFLYIIGLLILITGLIGVILYDSKYLNIISEKTLKLFKVTGKIVKYVVLFISIILLANLIEDTYLVKEVRYIDDYNLHGDDLFIDFTTDQLKVNYKTNLPDNISNPSVKIYIEDQLLIEGDFEYRVIDANNYQFYYEDFNANIEIYLLGTLMNAFYPDEITSQITYTLNGRTITNTYELSDNYLNAEFGYKYIWIWNYNKLVD